MKKPSGLSFLLGLSAVVLAFPAGAENYPTKAFDATYGMTGPQGNSTMRMVSDGKGHVRSETSAGGQRMITISDYPGHVAITLMEAQKMAIKVPLREASEPVTDEVSARKHNAKSLGSRVVLGHPCKGWQYSAPEGQSEVWVGDDIGYLVRSTNTSGAGTMTMELKTFNGGAPAAEMFTVPAGYHFMPTGM